jgi:hypothetical protein
VGSEGERERERELDIGKSTTDTLLYIMTYQIAYTMSLMEQHSINLSVTHK